VPKCGLLTLSLYSGDNAVTRRMRTCRHALTWADYQKKATAEWTMKTRQKRVTVAA
jgi:hypothetical protein